MPPARSASRLVAFVILGHSFPCDSHLHLYYAFFESAGGCEPDVAPRGWHPGRPGPAQQWPIGTGRLGLGPFRPLLGRLDSPAPGGAAAPRPFQRNGRLGLGPFRPLFAWRAPRGRHSRQNQSGEEGFPQKSIWRAPCGRRSRQNQSDERLAADIPDKINLTRKDSRKNQSGEEGFPQKSI